MTTNQFPSQFTNVIKSAKDENEALQADCRRVFGGVVKTASALAQLRTKLEQTLADFDKKAAYARTQVEVWGTTEGGEHRADMWRSTYVTWHNAAAAIRNIVHGDPLRTSRVAPEANPTEAP
jgi:citrate synthase